MRVLPHLCIFEARWSCTNSDHFMIPTYFSLRTIKSIDENYHCDILLQFWCLWRWIFILTKVFQRGLSAMTVFCFTSSGAALVLITYLCCFPNVTRPKILRHITNFDETTCALPKVKMSKHTSELGCNLRYKAGKGYI